MVGREEGFKNHLQRDVNWVSGGRGSGGQFFRFQRNLKLLGGFGGFPSNALGTQMYNFEMLNFNREFFDCSKTDVCICLAVERNLKLGSIS